MPLYPDEEAKIILASGGDIRANRESSITLINDEKEKGEQRNECSEEQIIVAWNLDDPENPYNWSKVSVYLICYISSS